jgi:trigger factor
MQSTLESIGQLERRLTMTVPASEIDRQVDDRLKKLARTVRMAGFRPGKAPLKIVAQQYGPQVRSEVIGDAVQRAFSDAVREQNLRIAGYPRFEPRDAGDAGQLAFSATFEIYPEVVPGDISQVTIERSMLTVGEDEVERTLQVLRKQRTQYEEADRAAATGDRVTIDFVGTIDGVEFAGGRAVDHAFVVGEGRMLSDLEAGIVGMARGATKTVPVTFPADYHAAELAGKAADFAVTMKKVEAAQLPEVDAAFAKSLGVEEG